jgi:hypothetical protein
MPDLGRIAEKVRSKNAGPFWLTIDVFCGTPEAFTRVSRGLTTARVAALFGAVGQDVKRFDIPDLNVIKFSLPRPQIQGARADRDMHGAGWAALLAELDLEE